MTSNHPTAEPGELSTYLAIPPRQHESKYIDAYQFRFRLLPMNYRFSSISTAGLPAILIFLYPAWVCAEDNPATATRIQENGGVTIKARVRHPKPHTGDACPILTPGYTISPREAVDEASIRDWAHNGVVRYQAMLGEILLTGKLAPRDPLEASYWLNCAAQAGHEGAALNLAMQIYHEDGVEQDYARVMKLAEPSARNGSALAQRLLGNMWSLGQGVPIDAQQAVKWHTLAAQQGDVDVQAALGYRFLTADGVKRDLDVAIKWLRLASAAGHEDSQGNLEIALCIKDRRCDDYGNVLVAGTVPRPADFATKASRSKPKTLLLTAHWQPNQTMQYVIEKTRQRKGTVAFLDTYEVHVRVVQKLPGNGYLLELTLPVVHLPDRFSPTDPEINKLFAQAAASVAGMRVKIVTDSNGTPQQLQNWQEIRATIRQVMDNLSQPMVPSKRAAILKTVEDLYADEVRVRELTLTDLGLFLIPLGDELAPNELVETQGDFSASALGTTLKVQESYLLKKDQPKSGLVTETVTRVFDPEVLSSAIDAYLKKLPTGQTPSKESLTAQMDIREHSTFVVDLKTGWLVSGEHIRDVDVNSEAASQIKYRIWRK